MHALLWVITRTRFPSNRQFSKILRGEFGLIDLHLITESNHGFLWRFKSFCWLVLQLLLMVTRKYSTGLHKPSQISISDTHRMWLLQSPCILVFSYCLLGSIVWEGKLIQLYILYCFLDVGHHVELWYRKSFACLGKEMCAHSLVCRVISNVLSPLPITADEDLGLNSLNLFLVSFSCTAVQLCLYNVRGRAKIDSTKTGESHWNQKYYTESSTKLVLSYNF